MNANQRTIISAALLLMITLLVLGRLCAAEFVQFDDPQTIANNPAFNPPTIENIARYWIKPEGNLYIPLTYSTWGALGFIARVDQPDESGSLLNPWVFHTANVVIHCATTLVVFAILRSMVRCRGAAWIGAALFAIHPVQVETVAWASGTKDLLFALFMFAAILLLIRYRGDRRNPTFALATLCMIAACLSKPTGIVTPAIALVIDVMFLRIPLRRSLVTLSSWFVIAIVFAIVGRIVQPPLMTENTPLWLRPLVALDALAFYICKLAWPAQLAIDYGRTPARIIGSGAIRWTWLIPVAIATSAIVLRRRSRNVSAGLLIALIGVTPVLGIVPFTFQTISTVADHYLYPSILGTALLAAAFASRGRLLRWIGFALIIVLGVRSFFAAATWMNNNTLFANALSVNPRSAFAHTNWGVALARQGNEPAAVVHFEQAVSVDPNYAFGHSNLAAMLQARGRYAEAAHEYRELLRIYRRQRNFNAELGVDLQQMIDRLESMATTQPASRETR